MTDQVDPWCNDGAVEPTDDEKKGFKDNFVVKDDDNDDADRLPDHRGEYIAKNRNLFRKVV